MALADYDTYVSKVSTPFQITNESKNSRTLASGRTGTFWILAPNAGTTPTTAVAPTRTTTGALGQYNSSGTMRLAEVELYTSAPNCIILADRLSHQGGLDGTVTTAQTTNLPTAALTRYTSGEGVMAAIEIYVAVGATGVDLSVSYTNQAGTGSRTSVVTTIGSTGFNAVARLIMLPLQEGDTGVRSVESVTLSATTGTAGAFGVVLFKPLFVMPLYSVVTQPFTYSSALNMCGNMPVVVSDACLFPIACANSTSTGLLATTYKFIED